jgi:outer membrane protein assembly factor BamB
MAEQQRGRSAPGIPLWMARWTGRALIAATALAVVWPPFVEWGGRRWSWPVAAVFAVAALAAAVMLTRLTRQDPWWRPIRPMAALIGAAVTVVVLIVAALVEHAIGMRVTADSPYDIKVLTVLGAALLALGWLLIATRLPEASSPEATSREAASTEATGTDDSRADDSGTDADSRAAEARRAEPWPPMTDSAQQWLAPTAVIAAIAAIGTVLVAAPTAADRTTARPLPAVAAQQPGDLNRERWSVTVNGHVWTAGPYLVVDIPGGVEVRDAQTGRVRWHYRAHDTFSEAVVSADGRTVVVVWPSDEQPHGAGFDVATGAQLWASSLPEESPVDEGTLPLRLVAVGRLVVLATEGFSIHSPGGFAIDATSGAVRWRLPDPPEPGCEPSDVTRTAADVLILAYDCRQDSHDTYLVVGLSGADGRVRWTWSWHPSPTDATASVGGSVAHPLQVTVQARGDQVYVFTVLDQGPAQTVALDGATGAEKARHTSPFLFASPLIGDDVAAYPEESSLRPAGRIAGVDLRTGQLRWVTQLPNDYGAFILASTISGNLAYLVVGASLQATDVDLVTLDLTTGATGVHHRSLPAVADAVGRDILLAPGRLIVVSDATPLNDKRREATALG